MTLRSPLGTVLGSGSAKDGTGHWWAQRISAVALVILGLWFLVALQMLDGLDHQHISTWVAQPFNSVMLALLAATLAYHSAIGLQVVIEDYVHGPTVKFISLILNKFIHVFLAAAALIAILRITLGGGT